MESSENGMSESRIEWNDDEWSRVRRIELSGGVTSGRMMMSGVD